MAAETTKLLVVEDDPGIRNQLRWCFERYQVLLAGDRTSALEQVRRHRPPLITLDLGLPPDADATSEGFATLDEILALAPDTKVVVVTGNNDRENAVRAVGRGAYDFYYKPIDPVLLGTIINRAARVHELEQANRQLMRLKDSPLDGVLTASPQMLDVCRTIEKVAPSTATVLLKGETGTGKELLARSLHRQSPRSAEPFIAVNCAAIPENLLESELFGHERGAFTGAVRQTPGKIEYANKGTLFLDEIGDLPLSLQAKLLRFLQERTIERVGGRREITVDVRVICATHQDLEAKIERGEFRSDLYYRISEISVRIPPLSMRQGDVLLLARFFIEHFNDEHGRNLKGFTSEAIAAMEAHPWPGNVRELRNRIKRAVIMAEGRQITPKDLELSDESLKEPNFNLREVRDRAEREAALRALSRTNGNVARAAELLGVSRPTMYDLMRKYNL
ncbi:Fis family transcriptional regulator [Sulfurifustis variabilis]|uniref:Fis family transcriptional regulator n=1 Tax=Sulfurifustis variabilis TaxID=1675686 RepID=A0A1B4V397_9GAMM|nr:PEP-CTERM-box response regulator transcription factor [Sulfurifustis variabilis]BAU48023.1 Fis family transcriptional regulator [Sulfurifustis variabilis]